jgi:mono/diheme cytochrome c family protein
MKTVVKSIVLPALFAAGAFASPPQGDSENGAKVWADTCARCHNVRPPSNLSERVWKLSMKHMRVRANLTGEETRDILAFILQSKQ